MDKADYKGEIEEMLKSINQILDIIKNKCFAEICKRKKVRKTILFESLSGYDGSSRAIYEYLLKNKLYTDYKFIWAVKDKTRFAKVNRERTFFVNYDELCFDRFLAEYIFFEHIPTHRFNKKQNCVFLTHGQPPLKSSGMVYDMVNYCLCTSENIVPIFKKWVTVKNAEFVICEMPKNDYLFSPYRPEGYMNGKKVIMFMPTFRKSEKLNINDSKGEALFDIPIIDSIAKWCELDEFCKKRDIAIVVKPHPNSNINCDEFPILNNIKVLTNEVIQENDWNLLSIMGAADALISDYSTVAMDFMLLDRPLAYDIADLENGNYTREFIVDDPYHYMPGNKLNSYNDLLEFIEMVSKGEDYYKEERRNLIAELHTYFDSGNTERLLKGIKMIK